MPTKSPLAITKERFGEKSKLVEAVKAFTTDDLWTPRTNADRGGSRGLDHVSNAKLLRLHATFTEVKEKFGTRAKLIDSILAAERRSKDAGLRKRLEAYPVPRLYDLYKSSDKRAKRANGAAEGKASASKASTSKAPASKASTSKASTSKASTSKASTSKASTSKASASKAK